MSTAPNRVALGIEHKNYLNLKNNPHNPWKGSTGTDSHGHAIFDSPAYGLRAAILNLRTYWFSYGLRTVAAIVSRWAPPDDTIGSRPGNPPNDPGEYTNFICGRTHLPRTENLALFRPDKTVDNANNLLLLVEAMAAYECGGGFSFPVEEFNQALELLQPGQAEPLTVPVSSPVKKDPPVVLLPKLMAAPENILAGLADELRVRLRRMTAWDFFALLAGPATPVEPPEANAHQAAVPVAELRPPPAEPPETDASTLSAPGAGEPAALPAGGFTISGEVLTRLLATNAFPLPEGDDFLFFGIRGCLPADVSDHAFAERQTLKVAALNYNNPRCTIGQWNLKENKVAVFPGSTIPTGRYVRAAVDHEGQGTNQLLPGYYHFVKGIHHAGTPRAHAAFLQEGSRIYRRTADNTLYEPTDITEIGVPFDNLHAAFCPSMDGSYSSAGCQVVLGVPKCEQFPQPVQPWPDFHDNAYRVEQERFQYLLLDAAEVVEAVENPGARRPLHLRCGSDKRALPDHAGIIEEVQQRLASHDFYHGDADGIFGAGSALAVVEFQRASPIGAAQADGVVGPQTAEALGVADWPVV